MPFHMPDLIVESVLRDGLTVLRRKPELLEGIFKQLTHSWMEKKYGQKEVNKIKDFFSKGQEISIVHSYGQVPSTVPCISIQLLDNPEDTTKAGLEDFIEDEQVPYSDPADLQAQIVVGSVTVTAMDPLSGQITVADGADLSQVKAGFNFVDASGNSFPIVTGISNTPGSKGFFISKGYAVDNSTPGKILSPIDFHQYTRREIRESEKLILGIHTKEPLLTKYLYTVIKHMLESRKVDLQIRGLQEPTFSGSDFSRNFEYPGDQVATRFLTVSGFVQNSWTDEEVIPIDEIDVVVTVPIDQATTVDAGLTNMTVQIQDDPEDPQ